MGPVHPSATPLVIARPQWCPGRVVQHEPVTLGVPFPRGLLRRGAPLALTDQTGRPVPLQVLPAEFWPDGTIRWAFLDFQIAGAASAPGEFRLALDGAAAAAAEAGPRISTVISATRIDVDTGVARFHLATGGGAMFDSVSSGAATPLSDVGGLTVVDGDGRPWPLRVTKVSLEQEGLVRSTVRLDGSVGPAEDPLVDVLVRVQFFAGTAATRIAITLHNPRRAQHPGGFWELGDPGSVFFREVSLAFAVAHPAAVVGLAAERLDPVDSVDGPVAVYQDSSGGEHWKSAAHVNRRGEIPLTFRGYKMSGAVSRTGLRATPAAVVGAGDGRIGLAVEQFWQNFPKSIEASPEGVTLQLWPRQSTDPHELQGGEQKTHHFVLILGQDPIAEDAVYWGRTPTRAFATPEWYSAAGAVPYLAPAAADVDDRYARLVAAAVDGPDSFEEKRERADEYGWRHFGDLYADHENGFSGESEPIVSHYNNQYDGIAGCAAQFMRSGDPRWWTLMQDLATHVADIDIYHTDRDKAAYNHGLFWHTFHYVPAGRSSHRSYPRHPRVWGGGPGNEHNYAAGLRLHWLLTGDPQSRDAAVGLAQWVVDMDDGAKTPWLRWLTAAPTGLASATQSADYHGPGRGAGHSILALLDGHRLTGRPAFLDKAEELIRRCVHPADDIAARDLLDAERRWSYVVFLQVLGKYLDYKEELGQADAAFAYGRAALLHYARWMAAHEYPYLQKPEILEYPTETWAAQDMRKCEVFLFAAQHASGDARARFVERARFFFDYSVSTLLASPTRTLSRPLSLLLSNGFMGSSPDVVEKEQPAGVTGGAVAPVTPFVTQKVAARKRLLAGAALFAAVVVLAVVAAIL